MSFPFRNALGKFLILAGMAVAFTACNGGSVNTTPLPGSTPPPTTYTFLQTITGIPGLPPTPPKTFGFDIGFVDETVNQYYLADKNTNGVDVVNSLTSQYLGTAGGGSFQGAGTAVAGFVRAPNGGPNGVVPIGGGLVAAGDGNSTLKIVSATSISGTPVASIPVPNPYTGPNLPPNICQGTVGATTGAPTVGAGNFRVDELGYDPSDNVIAAVSDNACPVFVTFFQGTAPFTIVKQVALLTANGGGEQPVWDPGQNKFLIAIPSTTTNPNGEIDVFDPKNAFAKTVLPLSVPCGPTGLALGRNETMVTACSGLMLTFNAVTGATMNQFPGPSPDEVWYSPNSNRFYGADTGRGMLVVLDGGGSLVFQVPTSSGAHSVAVEGLNDHVFVPQSAGPNIGITIFDH
jgi:hypothetical protein